MSEQAVRTENHLAPPAVDLDRDCFLLDVDGTILDIAAVPEGVIVPDGLVDTIAELSRRTSGGVAFVSGRKLETLDALFAPLKLPTVGCHGAEFRSVPGGPMQSVAMLSDEVKRNVAEMAMIAPGVLLEDKGYTLAVHYRLCPDAGASILRALMERRGYFAAQDLQILRGKAVFEVKPRWYNKGTGVEHLLGCAPFSSRRPLFFGDDTTDEDVFRVLPDHGGRGFAVGREIPGAAHVFPCPADVRDYLSRLVAAQ
ncbi:MAG: trehalose-phosphatase [Alphaproteobacteria bacterium]|nr:trehalose-phosphatase [Alphaproteobacteria bacterium]